ncbi:DUF3450 domain-containing protein (plasmid) [Macrococcoides canis]|uniref:coiled-coil domain-containing protein n=1 Tax=Macrococcoides canis TaxID=1855823 RepID=UPI001F157DAC|nr:DUF3450 domain-containing protein [Macrococcus canis]UJS28992.1 DUF3450 domain-containing protein [Macrococcus canis]
MKETLIDIKQKLEDNRTMLYWIILLVFFITNFTFIAYSKLKAEELKHEPTKINTELSLNGEKIMLLNTFYNQKKEQLEIILGVNNVKSVFDETYLKGEYVLQNDLKKKKDVVIKKVNPQIISIKLNKIPKNYMLTKFTLMFKDDNTDLYDKVDMYVKHDKEVSSKLSESDYKNLAINFKKLFVENEIKKLNKQLSDVNDKLDKINYNKKSLKSDDALLTEDEKEDVKNTIETYENQEKNIAEQIKKIRKEISEREQQLDEIDSLNTK